ncbi:transglutaminase domain-containing protein [archaeon]|nr:transglutaminase domain-containing protein [archaeon]MBT4022019.1 transglutaminase domain-containing protein [archaeon]MBT4272632.1 transglutaminase domain-containing protein [archaeon]MBT4461430.1 transglutaminase domain-containing protein [archaeon]MBT4857800.1 transglutaminase domain-containing protein [archaeon]
MKKTFILLLILMCFSVYAEDSIFNYKNLNLDLTISSHLELTGDSSSSVDYLKTKLYLYPQNGRNQEVLSLTTTPSFANKDDYLELMWAEDKLGTYNYELNSIVKTNNNFPVISKKIDFPIKNLDSKYAYYLENTKNIDVNNDIIAKASELATGEDDLYQVVFNLAEWTLNNIEYNLTTLTAEASEPSSWVLQNRYGVCDEITNLFISFCRSLGIPARFVSGISYTNSDLFESEWGLHGWAEVYFPEHGWVSFDPTYGQFGYTDATHIKLRDSIDSDKSSTRFEWQAHNVELNAGPTNLDVKIVDYGNKLNKFVEIEIIPLSSEVSLDSFNLIEVKVKNLKNYYISTELILSKAIEVKLHDSRVKYLLLGPKEEKSVYYIVEVDDLKKNYIYTFPIEVFDSFGYSKESSFKSKEKGVTYTFGQIWQILTNIEEQKVKKYSRNIDLNCIYPSSVFYNESFGVSCLVKNNGNVILENLKVCLEKNCEKINLGISQTKNISFTPVISIIGESEIIISAKNSEVTKTNQLRVIVEDKPKLNILDVVYPDILEFGPEFKVDFQVSKTSIAKPKNAVVSFYFNDRITNWNIDEIDATQRFTIELDKSMLNIENNNFAIKVVYYDNKNNEYIERFEKNLPIKEPSFIQKIVMWFSKFGRDMDNLLSK